MFNENSLEVKKGKLGESIVKNYLEEKGYIVYSPSTRGAHAFDFMAVKNKQKFIIAEVKSKARMNKYYATGINVSHYNDYKYILDVMQNIDIILFFVDEHPNEQRIYCQNFSKLIKEKTIDNEKYPKYIKTKKGDEIVIFHLSDMVTIYNLNDLQANKLVELSTRNYDYKSEQEDYETTPF